MKDPASHAWLLPFAVATTCSLAATERQHSHNKHFCDASGDQALWEQFVAQSVLHQAKCIFKSAKAQQDEDHRACIGDAGATSTLPPSVHKALSPATAAAVGVRMPIPKPGSIRDKPAKPKARSAKELFKADFIQKLKAEGEHVNVASKAFWNKFREAWAMLGDDRKKIYQDRAKRMFYAR